MTGARLRLCRGQLPPAAGLHGNRSPAAPGPPSRQDIRLRFDQGFVQESSGRPDERFPCKIFIIPRLFAEPDAPFA